VVTEKNETIKACLSGTVLYAGFTRQDGYIVILDHGNGYSSVYKHARKALKKTGDRVQIGDPVAIVGNTGENTNGPHLHFELWYNQAPVNPEDYITFTR
jgi:murein DD-endopeptidase MepM/ murein hydrolase activator NlpD